MHGKIKSTDGKVYITKFSIWGKYLGGGIVIGKGSF